ncbi:MAG: rhodanese-like domain-containing protein [Sulfurimonas sp.]|uniref:rhodanese-like domain-containing protein n=1 Tax=Sulfurimonas sp. TaxID=2022749 RepID=UPI0025D1808B|nr:rhodanese-like domain-containing protein [Sulfurimonas sp.]MCK9455521.1 rhodanese-like domain-containing protein [Sulfurimonas sp.]
MKHIFILLLLTFYSYAYDAFISPEELKNSLKDEKLVLLDVSSLAMYEKSHIAGALHADISKFTKSNYARLASAQSKNVQNQFKKLGINRDSHVVIYSRSSDEDFLNSTFLAFTMIEHGFENISILEGGYMAWVFKYHTLVSSKKSSAKKKGTYKIKYNPTFSVGLEYIKTQQQNIVVVDGSDKVDSSKIFTDISYIIDRSYKDNFFDDFTLRSDDNLESFRSKLDLFNNKKIIVYDENIFKASTNWYILYKKFNFKNVKILTALKDK